MANKKQKILIKRSKISGRIPTLDMGEMAINLPDKYLYVGEEDADTDPAVINPEVTVTINGSGSVITGATYSETKGKNAAGGISTHTIKKTLTLTKGNISKVDTADKLGTATKGSVSKPIYLNTGVPTECQDMVGEKTAESGEIFNDYVNNKATGKHSHAEGEKTTASDNYSHAEGIWTIASGTASHAEGINTTASARGSHAEGWSSNIIPDNIDLTNNNAIKTAWETTKFSLAKGDASHVSGMDCLALGDRSHAEGEETIASGNYSHAEGYKTTASSGYTHAEGYWTTASSGYTHAEGNGTTASSWGSHAEGIRTTASGAYSHAEGYWTTASGDRAHTEGYETKATGESSHAEGYLTTASGEGSHAEGRCNMDNPNWIHMVGIGEDTQSKNAYTITKNGKHYILGIGGYTGTEADLSSVKDLASVINASGIPVKIKYSELKVLKDNKKLIPGQKYEIIDYSESSTQPGTNTPLKDKSNTHKSIIITAINENTFKEEVDINLMLQQPARLGKYIDFSKFPLTSKYEIYTDATGDINYGHHNNFLFCNFGIGLNPYTNKNEYVLKGVDNLYPTIDEGQIFYYCGTKDVDGTMYDKWRKWESPNDGGYGSGEYNEDNTEALYILTDQVIGAECDQSLAINEDYVDLLTPIINNDFVNSIDTSLLPCNIPYSEYVDYDVMSSGMQQDYEQTMVTVGIGVMNNPLTNKNSFVLYLTDYGYSSYIEPDIQQPYFYEGKGIVEGVTYDKWRKISYTYEDSIDNPEFSLTSISKKYIYTPEIVKVNNPENFKYGLYYRYDPSTSSIMAPVEDKRPAKWEEMVTIPATYFYGSHPEAWKAWYCFDNDKSRFSWADDKGTGVIYRLIDEYGNDMPYDFKSITIGDKFAVSTSTGTDATLTSNINNIKMSPVYNESGAQVIPGNIVTADKASNINIGPNRNLQLNNSTNAITNINVTTGVNTAENPVIINVNTIPAVLTISKKSNGKIVQYCEADLIADQN